MKCIKFLTAVTEWNYMFTLQVADDIIAISNSFNIEAKIIGRVEKSSEKKLTITSKYGEFSYK